MGSAHSLFSTPAQDAALAQLAGRLGPHPLDRVAQAAALSRVIPAFDDLDGDGVGLPGVDPTEVATLQPLTDLIDTLACDTIPVDPPLPGASTSLRRALTVTFPAKDLPTYTLGLKRQPTGWGPRRWSFDSPLGLRDVQAAYLLLVGVLPSDAIIERLPWGLVPGFLEAAQQLQEATSLDRDPLTIPLPANVVVLALTHALVRGATLTLD